MFRLPWYWDRPLLTAGVVGGIALITFLLWRSHRRESSWVRGLCDVLMAKLLLANPTREQYRRYQSGVLITLAVLFASMSAFGLMVGTGIIKNGFPAPPFDWPDDAEGLIQQLNDYDQDLLEAYESGSLEPDGRDEVGPHTVVGFWVEEHRKHLEVQGFHAVWDAASRQYRLSSVPHGSDSDTD